MIDDQKYADIINPKYANIIKWYSISVRKLGKLVTTNTTEMLVIAYFNLILSVYRQ